MLYILSYTFPNASFNCKVLTNFLYLNKLFLVLFIIGSTSKKGATRLSFALAHDVRRLSATLTDILTSVGGSSPNTFSRVFATDCLQSTNKKKPPFQVTFFCLWSGQRDWLDFLLKNLRRCVGFVWRYSRLAKHPCQTRYLACSHPLTSFFKIEKAVINTAFSILVVVFTRYY